MHAAATGFHTNCVEQNVTRMSLECNYVDSDHTDLHLNLALEMLAECYQNGTSLIKTMHICNSTGV